MILRLLERRNIGEHVLEHTIGPLAEERCCPEVGCEWNETSPALVNEFVHPTVDLDVSPAKAVDRLLRVADDEQRARPERHGRPVGCVAPVAGQPGHHFGLNRVGVLELIDEEPLVLLLQGPPHRAVLAEHAGGALQEVFVLQRQRPVSMRTGKRPAFDHERDGEAVDVVAPCLEEWSDSCPEVGKHPVDVLAQLAGIFVPLRPAAHRDPEGAFPRRNQINQVGRMVSSGDRDPPLAVSSLLENLARRVVWNPAREQRVQLLPESVEGRPRRRRVRCWCVASWELDLVECADRREGMVEIACSDPGIAQFGEQCASLGSLTRDERPPELLPGLDGADVVKLGEPRRESRLDGTLPEEMGAKRVDGSNKETLEAGQRLLRALSPVGIIFGGATLLEHLLKSSPQLCRGLSGECDRRHVLDTILSGQNTSRHPSGEALRLT